METEQELKHTLGLARQAIIELKQDPAFQYLRSILPDVNNLPRTSISAEYRLLYAGALALAKGSAESEFKSARREICNLPERNIDLEMRLLEDYGNYSSGFPRRRSVAPEQYQSFLEGLPQRYLSMHPLDEVLTHLEMAGHLGQDSVQLALKRTRHWYELTIVTTDRPFLFATIAGVLAAAGMNIGKVGAFSNQSGVVVDTFCFTDRFRTLEMNLPKWERFKETVHAVLSGKQDLHSLLRNRLRLEKDTPARLTGRRSQIQFDDCSSAHNTLVEVITQDRPGLLYRISSVLSRQNCNIVIALIDAEAQTATDVFYLTSDGGKLAPDHQERLRQAVADELGGL